MQSSVVTSATRRERPSSREVVVAATTTTTSSSFFKFVILARRRKKGNAAIISFLSFFFLLMILSMVWLPATRAWRQNSITTTFRRGNHGRIFHQTRPYFTTLTTRIPFFNGVQQHQQTTSSSSRSFQSSRVISSSSSSSTALAAASSKNSKTSKPATVSWKVGDSVLVDIHKDQSNLVPGVIEEVRKAGWYSIRLTTYDGGDRIQKVRKSQLLLPQQQAEVEVETHHDHDTINDRNNLPRSSTTSFQVQELPVEEPAQAMPAMTINVVDDDFPVQYPIDPEAPPPPPRMDDLDALLKEEEQQHTEPNEFIQQLQHFSNNIRYWVVFTDLHCAPSTLETSIEVLQRVHQLALRHNDTGVLFLGDFWHHRGSIRIQCLNAILEELETWSVPMIMIPGNHDQVTLGGHSHGLTPLQHAYRVQVENDNKSSSSSTTTIPGPLIFSHPTLFKNALFVPHIRDIGILESVLSTDSATLDANAIFVHADVTGAYMNDMIVSTGGIHPSAFPSNIPIYSGHFHKPHTVTHRPKTKTTSATNDDELVTIEYLGSPYEVTLAEAQQDKALVVLDSHQNWKCVERIPLLSLGRKHYKPHSIKELLALKMSIGGGDADAASIIVREGDRIVATLPRKDYIALDDEVEDHIRQLRKNGVAVEIREDTATIPAAAIDSENIAAAAGTTTTTDLEDLSPASSWEQFWEEQVNRGAVESEVAVELKEAGMSLLEELDEEGDEQSSSASSGLMTTATNLRFDSVHVEGYGPFANRIEYPLNDRGLVLLRGSNLDGGSDSNGSGKTSLAMAALWSLTGSADPRPVQDNKVSDVVNDSNKNAFVTVTGHVNGKPFSITRTKTPKKSGLSFIMDGQDLTTQSVKETMVVVEEKLGVTAPVLARTMFHGQHSLNELLEATDAKLKEELSLVVPLELWQDAATLARSKGKKASKKESELEGMASLRLDDLEKFKERCLKAAADLTEKERTLEVKESKLENHKTRQIKEGDGHSIDEAELEVLRTSMGEATAHLDAAQVEIRSLVQEREMDLQVISKRLSKQMKSGQEATDCLQQVQLDYQTSTYHVETLHSKIASLESLWQVDLSSRQLPVDFRVPDTCPTCLQPISQTNGASTATNHDHHNIQENAVEDIKQTLHALESAEDKLTSCSDKLDLAKLQREENNSKVLEVEKELKSRTKYWDERVSHSEEDVATYQKKVTDLTKSFAANTELLQRATILESRLESEVNAAKEAVRFAKETYDSLKSELDSMEVDIGRLREQIKQYKGESRKMTSLSGAFGPRGVQTFVLQNAVKDLQSLTQSYLDDFSDGAQRLELSLDTVDNKISRQASVREPDGSFRERPLATLSGGQWRRCSLALTLGFADLVGTRGGLRPSMIVLDEPLTHLDRAGRSDVGKVLRKILGKTSLAERQGYSNSSVSTIIIILQDLAAEELEEAFDRIDEVVKQGGSSSVKVDECS